MQVTVRLFATFRFGRFTEEKRDYPPGTRVAEVLEELQIREGEVGVIMLNNRHVDFDQSLSDATVLAIFPMVGGG